MLTTLHPDLVETPMTAWLADVIDPAEMIRPDDIGASVRFLLRLSARCDVPELVLRRAGAFSTGPAHNPQL